MSLQHYIPAGFLGRFSNDISSRPNRDRSLAVVDLEKADHAFQAKAARIGGINNLYNIVDNNEPLRLDRSWNGYEVSLNMALSNLIDSTLDAVTWARVLVPFVTGLLVRGPEFESRYTERPVVAAVSEIADNTNLVNTARIFEMQRLLGPVLLGEWYIAKTSGKKPLITSDVGFLPFAYQPLQKSGIAIPLDQQHILVIFARTKGKVMTKYDEKWYPIVCPVDLVDADIDGINMTIAKCARRFLYAGTSVEIEQCRNSFDPNNLAVLEPVLMGFTVGLNGRNHEFTWHRLVSYLFRSSKTNDGEDFPIDWAALDDNHYWCPIVMVPLQERPYCPASITGNQDTISVDLSEIPEAPVNPVQVYVERTWQGPGTLYSD